MTATADDSQEEDGREAEPSSFFSRDDVKLLVITFAGTVAANVVTVIVVAIAIILARPGFAGPHTPRMVLLNIGYAVLGVPIVWGGLMTWRRKRPTPDPLVYRGLSLALIVAMGLMTLLWVLVLLGYAVGVK